MASVLSDESADWIFPSQPTTRTASVLSNHYDEPLPIRVHREGVQNYVKSRGTLNLGDWATEARRPSIDQQQTLPPKVIGSDALRNYTRSRSSTPNLIHGILEPPDAHHCLRVKREGRMNYDKNQNSQMKSLFENYGKFRSTPSSVLATPRQATTDYFYSNYKGRMGSTLNRTEPLSDTPLPAPHVSGIDAETNFQKAQGDPHMLEHSLDSRSFIREPHLNGVQAHLNFGMSQGHNVNRLFHDYGKLPESARAPPKVKYNGVDNRIKAQGDAMRKTISQCPPSHRYVERPQSVQSGL